MEQESRVNQDGGEEAGRDAPEEQIVEQAPQEESAASAGMAYAGFWRRFVAMIIALYHFGDCQWGHHRPCRRTHDAW